MMSQLEKRRPLDAVERRDRKLRTEWSSATMYRCAPFMALDPIRLDALVRSCVPVRFPRRGLLYEQGGAADSLYVVASGRVRVVRVAGETRSLTVAYHVSGELLGETALSNGCGYQATASATEPVEAVRVPLRSVQALLCESPPFSQAMLRLMVARRLEAERRVESLLTRSVESRVAEFLLDAAQRYGVPDPRGTLIGVRYTHQEIADYVGSTRETVTLTLGELRRHELVCFDHRRIVIIQRQELARIL